MTAHEFQRSGANLRGFDTGHGTAAMFQHGLGGDEAQVAGIFPREGFRRLTLECRAQGGSEPGPFDQLSIATFASDVAAFADARGVPQAVLGGISMGAAISLALAVREPARYPALVLCRPAWLLDKAPPNMAVFLELADHLERDDKQGFISGKTATRLATTAPDNLAVLTNFFARPHRQNLIPLLRAIASDGPGIAPAQLSALTMPVLVIGNAMDEIHPLELAQSLTAMLPNAQFIEIHAKALDPARHASEAAEAITQFLAKNGVHA